jgi:mRNA-degrading endonuclease RelE of RelBE toxin-antitoxin system
MTQATWQIRYASNVLKDDIPALGHAEKQRICKAIETKLIVDPFHFGKPLRYSLYHLRSLRVGDYRVLYHIDPEKHVISISAIGYRRDVYDE